jgi:hypothetical protein
MSESKEVMTELEAWLHRQSEPYWRERIAKEIDEAVIEVAGDSATTMRQAAKIARGNK